MSSNHPIDPASNGGQPERRGLRPAIAAPCRAALRDLATDSSRQHVAECSFCIARAKAAESLAPFAAQRPVMPAALSTASVLEGIYERIAQSPQHASLSEWVEQSPVPAPEVLASQEEGSSWDHAEVAVDPAKEALVGQLIRTPEMPDARVWTGVRRSILADVTHESAAAKGLKLTNWRILLAGAAASAVIGLLAVSDPAPIQPTIVFADLDRAPDIQFATIRYGSRR
jgi:hypothetical protein